MYVLDVITLLKRLGHDFVSVGYPTTTGCEMTHSFQRSLLTCFFDLDRVLVLSSIALEPS